MGFGSTHECVSLAELRLVANKLSPYDIDDPVENDFPVSVQRIESVDFFIDAGLSLPEKSTHGWIVDLAAIANAPAPWHGYLSDDERARSARFHFEQDRQRYSNTRGLLRMLVGAYVGLDPGKLRFTYAEKGKPELEGIAEIAFNVSHSGERALIGVTRHERIGVDVEKIRTDFDIAAIARRFFSSREQEELFSLPVAEQFQAFFQCWTLKESFIKALGEGLSHPLHQFDVSFTSGRPVSLHTRPEPEDASGWYIQRIDLDPGYAAAVTISRE